MAAATLRAEDLETSRIGTPAAAATGTERGDQFAYEGGECAANADWRSVPDWPEYEVSVDGRVRRIARARGARAGRQLKPTVNKRTGYLSVVLCRHCQQRRVDVHRLVALAFLGPQPSERHLVAHNDGSRTNNHRLNLRWATQSENLADRLRHGTVLLGAANPRVRVDSIDVRAMHHMKRLGIPRLVIAQGYGLHKRRVFAILAGTAWRSVA